MGIKFYLGLSFLFVLWRNTVHCNNAYNTIYMSDGEMKVDYVKQNSNFSILFQKGLFLSK